ncbi:PepSY-associated TM helix domain-containing protein [Parasphingorhabdus sp.]|uniref:PepSY-associated TM helix domain-containing protein n=1 Tax=Parasphingorhabdus sp. TaxID=2709688 RepID=UPI0032653D60
MSARRFFRLTHGWIGAVLALFLVLVAGSGVSLAFMSEMFIAQYGDVLEAEAPASSSAYIEIDEMLAAARDYQGETFMVGGVLMPHSRIPTVSTTLVFGIEEGGDPLNPLMVSVDPWTGEGKGSFLLADAFSHDMIDFHFELLMGDWGVVFVSILGFLLVGFAITGIWLWWPTKGSALKKMRKPILRGRWRDKLFHLHGWLGVWTAVLVVFFALTGTATSKPEWFGPFLSNPMEAGPTGDQWAEQCAGSVSLGRAVHQAQQRFPGTEATTLSAFPGDPYMIYLRADGDVNRLMGDTIVWVHSSCEGVMATKQIFEESASEGLGGSMLSIHGGYIFGPIVGPILVVLTGLALLFFSISGVFVFFTRTLRRKAIDTSTEISGHSPSR